MKVGANEVFLVGVDISAQSECCQCENVANTNSQSQLELEIETGNSGNNGNNQEMLRASASPRENFEGVPLVACLDQKAKLDNEFFIELAKLKPEIVFFRDDAFTTDSARINVEQIFRQNSANTVIKVI